MWCVWNNYSNTISFLFFHPVPELQKTSRFLTVSFPLFDIMTITNSGPYTRKFTMSVLRSKEYSFKWKSRKLKTNGSLEKQIRRSAVVSMLWSPLPLSVTLLCGHSRTWFGYACRMQRAGKKLRSNECYGWTCMVTQMIFHEDAFSSWLLYNHTRQERGCQNK